MEYQSLYAGGPKKTCSRFAKSSFNTYLNATYYLHAKNDWEELGGKKECVAKRDVLKDLWAKMTYEERENVVYDRCTYCDRDVRYKCIEEEMAKEEKGLQCDFKYQEAARRMARINLSIRKGGYTCEKDEDCWLDVCMDECPSCLSGAACEEEGFTWSSDCMRTYNPDSAAAALAPSVFIMMLVGLVGLVALAL